jgi:hypothetical protein
VHVSGTNILAEVCRIILLTILITTKNYILYEVLIFPFHRTLSRTLLYIIAITYASLFQQSRKEN